jgi:hypothetical protein
MKKGYSLLGIALMLVSLIFVGGSVTARAQSAESKTKKHVGNIYHGTKRRTRKGWHVSKKHTKRYTHKTKNGTKMVGRKTWHGTKKGWSKTKKIFN